MDNTPIQDQEQIERLRLGQMAKTFLSSSEWNELVKPIIDNMIKGLIDIRNLKSASLDSEKKAAIEIKSRKLAAEYVSEIQTFLEGYVADAQTIQGIMEKKLASQDLYKRE